MRGSPMSGQWKDSTRRARLPGDWKTRVANVKERDGYQCALRDEHGQRCIKRGAEVDHIRPGDDHSYANLQLLCADHHKAKTQREASEARQREAARYRYPKQRHPGLI
ncbi:HNH endonuclease [Streptomyces malaysiensis]